MSAAQSGQRPAYDAGRTWVIKVGSSLLTANGEGLATELVAGWVEEIAALRSAGKQIVLVSSGAVAEGMHRLGMKSRPREVHLLQAAAAVGQMGLVQLYESRFLEHGLRTAQVLLTHDDTRSRERYINARSTLRSLVDLGVIPIVNENDTVATEEIRFGDNDTLAALVANLIEADTVLLLTDQPGLYTSDPRADPSATLVESLPASDSSLDAMASGGGALGRGGMVTKISAARMAARSGANTIIAAGREPGVITRLAAGEASGTLLTAADEIMVSRKRWLASIPARGRLTLDEGAIRVIRQDGRSLLPVGVTAVTGTFTRGDMVACVDAGGMEVARGLVNYDDKDARRIAGCPTRDIESLLGVINDEELIHRDNLVVS
ncbi:MAG: glutamate 5-kinase [Gammaproteobacteria bacterium]|nr:glutamate 5-kinase [Gammaproteobacteria bacterium]